MDGILLNAYVNSSITRGRGIRNQYEDLEIDYERRKPKLLSLIRAVVPDPMPEEKVEVMADLILAAQSLDEIECILVALRSELPLITILTRVRNITNITRRGAFEKRSNDGVTLKGREDDGESFARHRGRSLLQ